MLGNRFGYQPLPYAFIAKEFEILFNEAKEIKHPDAEVLHKWYSRDDNNVPPVYCIKVWYMLCILLLEWSTTSQRLWVYRISVAYAQKDPRFLFEKRRGQPREFWSLVSTIDGSTLPQDCVVEQLCWTQSNWWNKHKNKIKKCFLRFGWVLNFH